MKTYIAANPLSRHLYLLRRNSENYLTHMFSVKTSLDKQRARKADCKIQETIFPVFLLIFAWAYYFCTSDIKTFMGSRIPKLFFNDSIFKKSFIHSIMYHVF